jgi:hypothetical protein
VIEDAQKKALQLTEEAAGLGTSMLARADTAFGEGT